MLKTSVEQNVNAPLSHPQFLEYLHKGHPICTSSQFFMIQISEPALNAFILDVPVVFFIIIQLMLEHEKSFD